MSILHSAETYAIRGACFEVYNTLGPGFLEAVYQEALALEFQDAGIPFEEQAGLRLSYKGRTLEQFYKADFVCFGNIVVELKAVSALAPEHLAQILNYLKATGMEVGLLVNFGHYPAIEIRRVVRGYLCNPCKSVDERDWRASADDADGHGRGTGYPRNPCKSVDERDWRASADDTDGHGKGTGYPCNPRKSVDERDWRASADNADGHGRGDGLSAQSVQIRGRKRLESVRG